MNSFQKVVERWWLPILIGITYWLFDAAINFGQLNPLQLPFNSFLWPGFTVEAFQRLCFCLFFFFSAKHVEMSLKKVARLQDELSLNDFVIENTRTFAVLWATSHGKIIKLNKYAANKLGYQKAELLNQPIHQIIVDFEKLMTNDRFEELRKQRHLVLPAQVLHKNNTPFEAVLHVHCMSDNCERIQYSFITDLFICPMTKHGDTHAPCGRPVISHLGKPINFTPVELNKE